VKQSDDRAAGRSRPASFGRDPDERPAEDFTIRGGQAFHLVLHLDVRPDEASLEALRVAVRGATRSAVLDGYADAFAVMDGAEESPLGDGGAPPGSPEPEGGGGG
jgi:hypothetical protein